MGQKVPLKKNRNSSQVLESVLRTPIYWINQSFKSWVKDTYGLTLDEPLLGYKRAWRNRILKHQPQCIFLHPIF